MDVKENKKHNNHRTDNTPLRRVTNQEQQNQISERDITQLNMRERENVQSYVGRRIYVTWHASSRRKESA